MNMCICMAIFLAALSIVKACNSAYAFVSIFASVFVYIFQFLSIFVFVSIFEFVPIYMYCIFICLAILHVGSVCASIIMPPALY